MLASAFMPLLRAHIDDKDVCKVLTAAVSVVSDFGKTPCGSVPVVRSCAPVLLEALRRHAADPYVAARISALLATVVIASFGVSSPHVPSELGNLQAAVALLAAALRAAADAASQLPADHEGNLLRAHAASLTEPVRAFADALVPFEDEVARDPAMLAALAAVLRLQPDIHYVGNVAECLRSVLRIDQSGSHAQKRAVVALLRSARLGAAFCAAAKASINNMPRDGAVLALVTFFTRHGLHVDSSRGATPRAARTCDGCGAVETQEQLAALSPGSAKHRLCGRCLKVSYCSIACQHAAWPAHKVTCRAAEQS